MAATVTSAIGSLILTLDDPGRDDLDSVIVWASTTSGFTPGAGNKVYQGKSLSITLGNLTPLTTYYLRYAYVSVIEPDNYEISAQLSGTPSKIDGSIIVDGSITASQISANALRGKTLSGGVFIDGGSVATAAVTKPTDVATETTVYLLDTIDFPTSGAAIVYSVGTNYRGKIEFRYTGKTDTSLTGCSGLWLPTSVGMTGSNNIIEAGDVILAQPLPSFALNSYTSGNIDNGIDFPYTFRKGGGSALAISSTQVAQFFTYTAGQIWYPSPGYYSSGLSGVSGLSSFSLAEQSRTYIIDAVNVRTTVVASSGNKTSLTLSAASEYLNASGGSALLVSTTVTGIKRIDYAAASGTTLTLKSTVNLTAATYYVIPLFSVSALAVDKLPFVNHTNFPRGYWHAKAISSDLNENATSFDDVNISALENHALKIYGAPKTSESDLTPVYIAPPDRVPHIDLDPLPWANLSTSVLVSKVGFGLGSATFSGGANAALFAYDNVANALYQYQPIGATLRFSTYDAADLDAITFNDTSNTYTFSADGGTGNAKIMAATFDVGNADTTISRSSAGVIAVEGVTVPLNSTTNTHTAQTIELGHATDTTLSRASAGVLAVEGNHVPSPANQVQGDILYHNGTTWARLAAGTSGQVLQTGGTGANPSWITVSTSSGVTSVNVSGGTTGLTTSGGPITTSGTITLSGTLNLANGGTGATTISGARNALGLGTADSPQFSTVELGNATDTTISRVSAGVAAIEGDTIVTEGRANNFTADQTSLNGVFYAVQNTTVKPVASAQAGTFGQFIAWNANSTGTLPSVILGNQQTGTGGNRIDGYKARGGSTATPSAANNNDNMLSIRGFLYDGAAWQQSAGIKFDADAGVSANDAPGRIVFQTTADGTTTLVDRFRINNAGDILNISTGGLGFGAGSGGSVTQTSSRTTAVTLNKTNGSITLFTAAGTTAFTTFTVNNSTVAATDTIIIHPKSSSNLYEVRITAVAAGSFNVTFNTTGGTSSDTPVFNFSVIKAVTA